MTFSIAAIWRATLMSTCFTMAFAILLFNSVHNVSHSLCLLDYLFRIFHVVSLERFARDDQCKVPTLVFLLGHS